MSLRNEMAKVAKIRPACDTMLRPLLHVNFPFVWLRNLRRGGFFMVDSLSTRPRELFSLKNVFSTKHLVVMAALLAARTILGLPFLTIYFSGIKLITFAYLTDALAAMLYGPWAALVFGFAGDTLGFFASMSTGGAYLPFYALSEMATGFLFALFLYKRPIRVSRVAIAWALNLIIVILGMNSVWLILTAGKSAGEVLTMLRFGINLAQFPIHVALTWFILRTASKFRTMTD
ncbi:MAG: folate family ECF transporter S component [Clostridiales Family XIII bacterium]|jgi:ECF transporter S component (folate family)|nr:folate family ECF transporter S component [Clostridiales Family XIII bacterium]